RVGSRIQKRSRRQVSNRLRQLVQSLAAPQPAPRLYRGVAKKRECLSVVLAHKELAGCTRDNPSIGGSWSISKPHQPRISNSLWQKRPSGSPRAHWGRKEQNHAPDKTTGPQQLLT